MLWTCDWKPLVIRVNIQALIFELLRRAFGSCVDHAQISTIFASILEGGVNCLKFLIGEKMGVFNYEIRGFIHWRICIGRIGNTVETTRHIRTIAVPRHSICLIRLICIRVVIP